MIDTGSPHSYDEESDYYDAEYGEDQAPLIGGRGGRPQIRDEEDDEEIDAEELDEEEEADEESQPLRTEEKRGERGRSDEKYAPQRRSHASAVTPEPSTNHRPASASALSSSSSSSFASTPASVSSVPGSSRPLIPMKRDRNGNQAEMKEDEEEDEEDEEDIRQVQRGEDERSPKRKSKRRSNRSRCCGLRSSKKTICWLYLWGFLMCWMVEGLCVFFSRYSHTGLVAVVCGLFYLAVVTFVILYYVACKPFCCPTKRHSSHRSHKSSSSRHRRKRSPGSNHNLLPSESARERKRHRSGSGKRPPPVIPALLGALMVGIIAGVMGGYTFEHLWKENGEGVYENVDPYDNSTAYPQATRLHFIPDSYVKSEIGGLFAATNGHKYCAAPLLLKSAHENQPLSFIAVNIDCCRGSPPSTANNNVSTFSAFCQDWNATDLYGYVVTDQEELSSYSQAIRSGADGNDYQVSSTSYFVTLNSQEEEQNQHISSVTVGWLILAISPIVWPIGWFLTLGLTAVFTCAKSLSKATSPSL